MEKMREEFEAWISGLGYNTNMVDGGECREDYYEFRMTNLAWHAWQASRATLVVELPETSLTGSIGVAHKAVTRRCREAIEAAGVRVKA